MGALSDWKMETCPVRLFLITAAAVAGAAALPSAAYADRIDSWRELEHKRRECARKLDRADSRREYHRRLEKCRRQIAEAHYRLERQRRWEHGRDDHYGWRDNDWHRRRGYPR